MVITVLQVIDRVLLSAKLSVLQECRQGILQEQGVSKNTHQEKGRSELLLARGLLLVWEAELQCPLQRALPTDTRMQAQGPQESSPE